MCAVVPTISFSTSNYVVGEGDGTVEVCLQLNVPLVADIDFAVTAASGTGNTSYSLHTLLNMETFSHC